MWVVEPLPLSHRPRLSSSIYVPISTKHVSAFSCTEVDWGGLNIDLSQGQFSDCPPLSWVYEVFLYAAMYSHYIVYRLQQHFFLFLIPFQFFHLLLEPLQAWFTKVSKDTDCHPFSAFTIFRATDMEEMDGTRFHCLNASLYQSLARKIH